MRSESVCSEFRADLSARLDGELDAARSIAVEEHLATCASCRRFEAAQHELRRTLRLVPAEPTPDVAPAVLAALAEREPSQWPMRFRLASLAGVAAAILILATSFPLLDSRPQVAGAVEISRRVLAAAQELRAYRATFDIVERGWHPDVAERRFRADVWYRAPENLRLRVRDRTDYPVGPWPANNVDLIATPSRSWIREPYACPAPALPGCAVGTGLEEVRVVNRQPFDGTSTAPGDIVVPLETLAAADAFTVEGTATVAGRRAYRIRLSYLEAFPLVDALQSGGSWAPVLPLDRIDVWVDRETWFPLRFEVRRPGERTPRLEVTARRFERPERIDAAIFDAPHSGVVRDGGFDATIAPGAPLPAFTAGLTPYRSGTLGDRTSLVSYARGMTYLKLIGRPATAPDITDASEVVELRPGSLGYYRPAGSGLPRRIDIYAEGDHIRIESNLRREQLLRVAASLPVDGRAPRRVRAGGAVNMRLEPDEVADISFALLPSRLPPGYRMLSATLRRIPADGDELAVVYSGSQSAPEGALIRLFQSVRIGQLPPSSEDLVAVDVGGSPGRWSIERGELEWIDGGIYRSIAAPSFDLATLLGIAGSLR
ncbi:MAG TPA: zf-HC2 domain-containing protein [Actinomycetota bacterium]|nr:zf-HC2 domain-containing protein [Actinomycetota bacterium]